MLSILQKVRDYFRRAVTAIEQKQEELNERKEQVAELRRENRRMYRQIARDSRRRRHQLYAELRKRYAEDFERIHNS